MKLGHWVGTLPGHIVTSPGQLSDLVPTLLLAHLRPGVSLLGGGRVDRPRTKIENFLVPPGYLPSFGVLPRSDFFKNRVKNDLKIFKKSDFGSPSLEFPRGGHPEKAPTNFWSVETRGFFSP